MMTKRKYIEEEHLKIVSLWPVFSWRRCIICDYEFRRMRGWRKEVGPYWGGWGNIRYICSGCAPDIKTAATYYDEYINPMLSNPPTAAHEIHQESKVSRAEK